MTPNPDLNQLFLEAIGGALRPLWPLWLLLALNLVIRSAWFFYKRRRHLRADIVEIDRMEGREFELYLQTLLTKMGYQVSVTPYVGDYGGDLIARKGGKSTVIQAKRYKKRVGVKAVQEALAARGYYNCTDARVITNSSFTIQAMVLAKANGVELWGREELVTAICEARKRPSESVILST
jgi:restriction system protein